MVFVRSASNRYGGAVPGVESASGACNNRNSERKTGNKYMRSLSPYPPQQLVEKDHFPPSFGWDAGSDAKRIGARGVEG